MEIQQKLDKALQLHQSGNLAEAEKLYNEVLEKYPNNPSVLYFCGLLNIQKQNKDKAITLLNQALSNKPSDQELKNILDALADVYTGIKDFKKASEYLIRSLDVVPDDFTNLFNLAYAFSTFSEFDKAVEFYRKAIRINPSEPKIYLNLIEIYKKQNQREKIIDAYLQLIEIDPKNPDYYYNAALLYREKNDVENAYKGYMNAIHLRPDFWEALINLSDLMFLLKDFNQAKEYALRAYNINNNRHEIYMLLGNVYTETNELDKVIEYSKEGLEKFPNNHSLLFNLARVQFLQGDIDNGWEYFKLRRIINEKKEFKNFLLDYHGPLENKTIFVYRDTGYGDTIQFARYIPLLCEKCKKVIFRPQNLLTKLIKASDLNAMIIEEPNPPENYDLSINLTTLAYLFKSDEKNIPLKDSYLKADPELVQEYKEKYFNNNKIKVGLMWYALTHPRKNVEHLNHFKALFEIENVQLYSLQKGEKAAQLKELDQDTNIIDLGVGFRDFSDTAAAIENLDLLISVDTAAAHLGGAMGKKTWTLLPFIPNWRWFLDREDCPYYTSMRLFRQTKDGVWDDVIEKIATELKVVSEK